MNVFYRGLDNPFDVGAGGIPHENLEVTMTNGRVLQRGDAFIIQPNELDEQGRRTTVTVHAKIGNERRVLGRTNWRVKKVPDPIAKVAGQAGGSIRKERLLAEDGVLAELEDFDFDFKYTVTQFRVEISAAGGYVNFFESNSNRFTEEQKNQFRRLNPNSLIYIANIKAVGTDGVSRDLDPISFKNTVIMKKLIAYTVILVFLLVFSVQSVDAQIVNGAFTSTDISEKKPMPLPDVREADVLWSKKVWRIIDLREK